MREGQSVTSFKVTHKQKKKKNLTHIFETSLIKLFSELRVVFFVLLMLIPAKRQIYAGY